MTSNGNFTPFRKNMCEDIPYDLRCAAEAVRTRNAAHHPFHEAGAMKKSLHPAAIATAIAALVAVVAVVFVRFGSGDVKDVSLQESMKIDANATNKVNSITGEPLLPDQLAAQERQREMIRRAQGSGVDPSKTGTVPNPQGAVH
jgi:hypothetical protein